MAIFTIQKNIPPTQKPPIPMRKFLTLPIFLFLATHLLAGSEPIEVPTAIKRVTVFIKGAQVFREGSANIPAGRSVLKFTGLINSLETNSILLDAEGDFTILSIRYQINYFEASSSPAAT